MNSIPAIGQITDPKKTRVALVQGQQIISAPATALSDAVGLPSGGSTGQVLTKSSGTDYDTEWANTGNFSGPASAVDGNLVAFDGTTGELGKDSGKKPADFATAAQGAKADTAVQPSAVRELLTANRNYYVLKTGSDSNNGLANTAGGAFLTVQKAINTALMLDMGIYSVTINVGAGTFAETGFLTVTGNGNARITIVGAGYTSTIITGSPYGLYAVSGLSLILQDLAVQGSSVCIWARYGAQVFVKGSVSLNGGSARLLAADNGAYIESTGTSVIYLATNSAYAIYATALGHILVGLGATIATTAARTFTATVLANTNGLLDLGGTTFDTSAGAVTGTRYVAALCGVINTAGGGATYIPGTINGTPTTGGQYA